MSMEGGAAIAADHVSLHHQPGTHSHASFSQQGSQGQARRSGLGAARQSENGVSQGGYAQQLQGQAQVQGNSLQLMQQHAEQQQQHQQQLQRLSEGGRPPQCSGAGGPQERFPSRRLSHAEPLQPQPQHTRGLMLDLGSAPSPSLSSAALPSPGNARSPPPNGCTGQGDLVLVGRKGLLRCPEAMSGPRLPLQPYCFAHALKL